MEGWIKLHRKILNWEWFATPNMFHLFGYLILSANHQDGKWKGIEIKRGQLICGIRSISRNTGISVRSVRTCINRLKSTHEVTIKSTHKYSIITICNYDYYNDAINYIDTLNDTQTDKQATQKRHSSDTKQEYKNDKNVKEEIILYWEKWKSYRKKEFGFHFNSEYSEIESKKELLTLSDNDIDKAMKIIDYTIASGYKKFIKPDNLKNNGNRQQSKKGGATLWEALNAAGVQVTPDR